MSEEPRRKLIEVALPLEAINRESAHEKSVPRRRHPATVHLWWARRPLAACRAVLFASLVDDPSSRPDLYSEAEADRERSRLFELIEHLARWESTTDERVLEQAREEIRRSTSGDLPAILDPFCGGGSIPLEAQRLGLKAHASDLNPVAVLITRALTEIPPRFRDMSPVNVKARERLDTGGWDGAKGLADDVRYYGRWIRDEAEKRIGDLYPTVKLPDGASATVTAWIWARTVKCPSPACGADSPLVSSFVLSSKGKKQAWIEPTVDREAKSVAFSVRTDAGEAPLGTVNRRGARCIVCESPMPFDHVRAEGRAGRLGTRLIAIVAGGDGGRMYLSPDAEHEEAAGRAEPSWAPETLLPEQALSFRVQGYGMAHHRDLFTNRQLTALTTFSDLVTEVRAEISRDAQGSVTSGFEPDHQAGADPTGYADALSVFLAFALDKAADWGSNLCGWITSAAKVRNTFSRHALPMVWDFVEVNPFSTAVGNWENHVGWVADALEGVPASGPAGAIEQLDATAAVDGADRVLVFTDPPYYDNIGYADLSDYFYIWLRRTLRDVYPDLFSTVLTPKTQELIAAPFRFDGSKQAARDHFEHGLREAFARIRETHSADYPMTLFYAFKQSEADEDGVASTGWETMLEGLLDAGFTVTGTWPMRTERTGRSIATGTAALASSILLVCRPRPKAAPLATRKEFTAALRAELPEAMRRLQSGSVAPVDLAQAAIGPGMAIFSRYSKIVEADGKPMRVRAALSLINEALDELLAEQEADFDADTRWCVAWFEQHGMDGGPFGVAETLSRAKNTAINGLVQAGVVRSRAGEVRLLDRSQLEETWDPAADTRLTVWEVTQHLIERHQTAGEEAAANLLRQVGGGLAEAARELAYRLFAICERKSWAQEALAYNALVTAWPEITRLAAKAEDVGALGQQEAMEV